MPNKILPIFFTFLFLSCGYVYSGTFTSAWIANEIENNWVSVVDTSAANFPSTPSYFTAMRTDRFDLARHVHGHLSVLFPTKDNFTISLVPVMDGLNVGDIDEILEGDLVLRWIGVDSGSEYFSYGVSEEVELFVGQGGFQFDVLTDAGLFDASVTFSQVTGEGWLLNRFTGNSGIYDKGWNAVREDTDEFYKFLKPMPIIQNYTVNSLQDLNMQLQWINIDNSCEFDWRYISSESILNEIDPENVWLEVPSGPNDVLFSVYDGSGTWELYDPLIVPVSQESFKLYLKSNQGDVVTESVWHVRWLSLEDCPENGVCFLCAPCQCDKGTCVNSICECNEGWEGDICSDNINECLTGHNCSETEYCEDTIGSYNCFCRDGWKGENCTDINECVEGIHNCTENGDCYNTEGSFECHCHRGWHGKTCSLDVDECLDDDLCAKNTYCDNTWGSYKCLCEASYITDNGKCFLPILDCWTTNTRCTCQDDNLNCFPIESDEKCVAYVDKPECSNSEVTITPDGVLVIGDSNSSTFDLSDVKLNINGDLTLTENLTLKKNLQNTITVAGCVNLSGTLEIDVSGVKDQDKGVIVKSSTNCINGDFNDIVIINVDECEEVEFERQKFSGNYTVLFKVTNICQSNTWLYITITAIIVFFVCLILLVLFVPSLRRLVFPHRRKMLHDRKNAAIKNKITELDTELSSLANRTYGLQVEMNQLDN